MCSPGMLQCVLACDAPMSCVSWPWCRCWDEVPVQSSSGQQQRSNALTGSGASGGTTVRTQGEHVQRPFIYQITGKENIAMRNPSTQHLAVSREAQSLLMPGR